MWNNLVKHTYTHNALATIIILRKYFKITYTHSKWIDTLWVSKRVVIIMVSHPFNSQRSSKYE